jgi:hypothetical protein
VSHLLRMTYGHGGTRLERVVVSSSLMESSPLPLWLRMLLLAVWCVVLVFISFFGTPKDSSQMKTVIDISNLAVKPPPAFEKTIVPQPEQAHPVEPPPPPPPEVVPEQAPRKPMERQLTPELEEVNRPSISRSASANLPDLADNQIRVTRDRRNVETETAAAATARLRRETMPGEVAYDKTTISRTRGATALDSLTAKERAAVLRRSPSALLPTGDDKTTISRSRGATALDPLTAKERAAVLRRSPSASLPTAGVAPQRPILRSERSVNQAAESAPRVAATRDRSKVAGGEGGGASETTTIGMSRSVSLQSLEICSSPQLQEDDTKALLRVVGSRLSCRDEKGEFQFKGTKRISSFNLILIPSPGRKPSNRCEELENAYNCLKNH